MARGRGGSLGAAIVAALADGAGGSVGVRKSYTATGWHAQISKLTSSDRGYLAAEKAGLSVSHRTLLGWLSSTGADGDTTPSKENQRRIAQAYAIMRGRWPDVEGRDVRITGRVRIGRDDRVRGEQGTSPLLLEWREGGNWARLRAAWESGDVEADQFEEWFVEDVVEDILGEGSDPWEFPGSAYVVEW